MRKTLIYLFLSVVLIAPCVSQETSKPAKFKGGMMLHTGYLTNSRPDQGINGVCAGIGGKLSFAVGAQLRIGTEGYASTLGYADQEGQYKLGWGGLLVDYQLMPEKRLVPVISFTIGGGHVRDTYFLESEPVAPASHGVVYRSYSSFLAAPSLSFEYSLKTKLTLVLKVDYAIPLSEEIRDDFAMGPRVYLGVLFNRH